VVSLDDVDIQQKINENRLKKEKELEDRLLEERKNGKRRKKRGK